MCEINDDKLWLIIDDIDWEGSCLKASISNRPYYIVGKKISEKYPDFIIEIRDFTNRERFKIIKFLNKHSILCGNDSGWDLTAHIIGCGKDYIKEVKRKVNNGEYNFNNIYNKIKYVENFQYSFNYALDYLIGSRDYDEYRNWLRNRKIETIINQ